MKSSNKQTAIPSPRRQRAATSNRGLRENKARQRPVPLVFYRGKINRFLAWLGDRASHDLFALTSADIVTFRTDENVRVSGSTVNHAIKVLRMAFEDARRDGIISDNPADTVKLVKRKDSTTRRPFTLAEIKLLLAKADKEWRSLIVFGLYTGQRLGDLARLTWANLDLEQNEIRLRTGKTGRQQIIPLAPPLRKYIETFEGHEPLHGPIHPSALASVTKSGRVGTLSRQFYELMAKAGLVPAKKHRVTDHSAGRNGRHQQSEISFHSLRHTATSLMKNAGISSAVVQDIIGHESAAISATYTHIDDSAKRSAVSVMPDVLATNVSPQLKQNE